MLLWCNDLEYREIENLLVKLGEIPAHGANPNKVRVVEAISGGEREELLERLRRLWPSLAPNELILPPAEASEQLLDDADAKDKATLQDIRFEDRPPVGDPGGDGALVARRQSAAGPGASAAKIVRVAQLRSEGDESETTGPSKAPPPVSITVGPDGRLIIASQDTAALDLIEQLIAEAAPPRKEYEIFHLEHALSYWVAFNLEDFFKEEEGEKPNSRYPYYFFDPFGSSSSSGKDVTRRLSKRRPLKFISDDDTNTILVIGADPRQLKIIAELIELYDVPEEISTQAVRVTQMFHIRYSTASVVAETIKDAYRDLLSSSDRTFAKQQSNQQRSGGPERGVTYISNYGRGGESDKQTRTRVTFKGKLSLGVDDMTNTILVSAEGENLLRTIGNMIEELDEAAKTISTVHVMQLDGGASASAAQQALSRILGQSTPAARPAAKPPLQKPVKPSPPSGNRTEKRRPSGG